MRVGDRVRVASLVDESADVRFLGKEGSIREVDVGHGPCPVGQSAVDPLLLVEVSGLGADSFWTEELAPVVSPALERVLSEPFCEACGDLLADHEPSRDGPRCPSMYGTRIDP